VLNQNRINTGKGKKALLSSGEQSFNTGIMEMRPKKSPILEKLVEHRPRQPHQSWRNYILW